MECSVKENTVNTDGLMTIGYVYGKKNVYPELTRKIVWVMVRMTPINEPTLSTLNGWVHPSIPVAL